MARPYRFLLVAALFGLLSGCSTLSIDPGYRTLDMTPAGPQTQMGASATVNVLGQKP